MNDELEQLLDRSLPPAADAALRQRVLAAVAVELGQPVGRRARGAWLSLPMLLTAALLLIAVGLNAWVFEVDSQRQAAYFPRVVPREILETMESIETVTDRATAVALQRSLEDAHRRRSAAASAPRSEQQRREVSRLVLELSQPEAS